MTIPPELHPAAKFERAREHFQALADEVLEYLQRMDRGGVYEVETTIDSGTRRCKVVLNVGEPVPEVRWGLLVGDAMHNLRSCLDHLIEAATIIHTGAPLDRTEFPVFDAPHGTGGRAGYHDKQRDGTTPDPRSGLHRVRGVDPQLAELVEQEQPYHASDPHRHPLWRLHRFDIIDKHRVIPVFGIAGDISRFEVEGWQYHSEQLYSPVRFQDGTLVAEFTLGLGPGPDELGVTVAAGVELRYPDTDPGFGEEVIPLLEQAMVKVHDITERFLRLLG